METESAPSVYPVLNEKALEAMGEKETEILNHLLFHKAMIEEPGHEGLDLDNYLRILEELDMDIQVVLQDPVDRAAAIAFQLVIDQKFDPWNIDLGEFTKLYLAKLKKEDDVNFIIAGKLVMMAWSILKSQSARVLTHADKTDEPVESFFSDWEIEPAYNPIPGSGFSDFVLGSDPVLTQAVRSNDVRPVTLVSLLEAFDEAREEMALRDRINKLVKTVDAPIVISDKLHGDSLQEDISATWQRICRCEEKCIPITSIWNRNDTYDKVTVFISSLFLAKMEKIELAQKKLPYGEIYITSIESRDMAPMENSTPMPIVPAEQLAVV